MYVITRDTVGNMTQHAHATIKRMHHKKAYHLTEMKIRHHAILDI